MPRPILKPWKLRDVALCQFLSGLLILPAGAQITLIPSGQFTHVGGAGGTEISAYDPVSKRLFCTNVSQLRIDVLDISNPAAPSLAFTVAVGGLPNSIAVRDGIVAVAVEDAIKTNPGQVKFYTTGGTFLSSVTVGALPDMLTFTPNGRRVLVANEGEPSGYPSPPFTDPEGSVSIIDMTVGASNLTNANVTTATFNPSIPVTGSGLRVFGPGATLAQDLEPEYIAVSHDSKTAWVTLQENNAIAELDIEAGIFTKIMGLGFKNHELPGNGLDPSDRDLGPAFTSGKINIGAWPVMGMYQPDAIDSYRVGGTTYLVMANEGDAREWPGLDERVRVGSGSYPLDPTVFPNASTLKLNQNLGRLRVTNTLGDTDGDGDYDQVFAFGARSFSIRTTDGTLVYDSGDQFEQQTALHVPALFNSNGAASSFDARSPEKGPEAEGIVVGRAFGRQYAFIVLERTGGVMVYDISNPAAPAFVQYVTTSPGDISPEGVLFINEDDSPAGKPLLVTSNEVSGTTRIFQISKVH